jgi:hypothetical protein
VLSPAASAYLAAFDAYLKASIHDRDNQFVCDLKQNALEHLLAQPPIPHRTRRLKESA